MIRLITLLAAAALTTAAPAQDEAPATALQDFDGRPRSLQEFTGQGKWTVVMIWAHDCHVCNEEVESYEDFHRRHRDTDATVLGISMDGQEKKKQARDFIRRHGLTFPNLIGELEAVADLFTELTGVQWVGTPTYLIYNPAGQLVAQQIGGVPARMVEDFIREQSAGG